MQIFVPEPDFTGCAASLDIRRLRSQINEALVILRTLRGESTAWANHPTVRAWRGCDPGVYLYREECRAEYARRTGDVWGVDATPPISTQVFLSPRMITYWRDVPDTHLTPGGILPPWWGDDRIHSSHRALLLGKWVESGHDRDREAYCAARIRGWAEPTAVRDADGRWPFGWPTHTADYLDAKAGRAPRR